LISDITLIYDDTQYQHKYLSIASTWVSIASTWVSIASTWVSIASTWVSIASTWVSIASTWVVKIVSQLDYMNRYNLDRQRVEN